MINRVVTIAVLLFAGQFACHALPPKTAATAPAPAALPGVALRPSPLTPRARLLRSTPITSVAFPTAWGRFTVLVVSATTNYDENEQPVQQIVNAKVVDVNGVQRGRVDILYTYATGAVSMLNGKAILTATVAQQNAIAASGDANRAIMNAAVLAAAKDIIVN